MKPKTEKLLQQCRAALLQYSNEQLNTLFVFWLEHMVGAEDIDEELDDLCLLLGYGIRSTRSQVLYATYTAWWEIEGYADPDGEFVCLDVAALQQHLIMIPIKQLHLVTDLAYQVCLQDAEGEDQPRPPVAQNWLRVLAAWLNDGAQEPFHTQIFYEDSSSTSLMPQSQRSPQQHKAQQRDRENKQVEQAWLKTLARLKAQGPDATYPDLADTVVLPTEWPTQLSKEQLGAFLTFLKLPASSHEIKANLVQHLLTYLETNKTARAQFFEVFAVELSVPPWELEALLGCTTTERKRWTEEQKLPVLAHSSFRKGGRDHEYALYDRRVILSLAGDDIERWRTEHQALVRERRRAAAATRKAKQKEAQTMQIPHTHLLA